MNRRAERLGWAGILLLLVIGAGIMIATPPVQNIDEVDSGGAPVQSAGVPTPTGDQVQAPAPVSTPASSPGWGPIAVVPAQGGTDTARTEGTLHLTETCTFVATANDQTLLLWPEDRTTWDARTGTITFANEDGSVAIVGDSSVVAIGGSGDSLEESGATVEQWLDRTPWVARPDASCSLERFWFVGDVRGPSGP